MKRLATVAIVGLLLGGCGTESILQKHQRNQAPTGATDVGVVVEKVGEADVVHFLNQNPNAKVRILNRDHGMYEIFGVAQELVQEQLSPSAKMNSFFYFRQPEKSVARFSKEVPGGLKLPGLQKCKKGSNAPIAKLEMLEPHDLGNGASLESGKKIKFSSRASASHPNSPSALKRALVVLAPSTATTPETVVNSEDYEFVPDGLGAYQVFVVVQDSQNLCAMDSLAFVVTANPAFTGHRAPKLDLDLAQLKHLSTVEAYDAWKISEGEGVLLAVIDTGINYNHPSLAPNVAINAKEVPGNGIDDDKNGFVDDIIGFDFVSNDSLPYDDDGHGTHVAGLAASAHFGLARKAQLLPIKAMTSVGGDVATIAAAIRYAVDRGARVINLSLGASAEEAPKLIKEAVNYAQAHGSVVVAAAGNGDPFTGLGTDIDVNKVFPASLENENLIAVGASEASSSLATYSNFGKNSVDVVAPGGHMPTDPIFSTAMENRKHEWLVAMSGTSMAAPIIAGIIADMIAANSSLDAPGIRQILLESGQPLEDLKDVCASGRIISAFSAVRQASSKNVLF